MRDANHPDGAIHGPARPSVTVIVPVRDDPRLASCLDSLEHQTYPAHLVRVVVADNGSRQGVADRVRGNRRVTVVSEPVAGSYRARNAAVLGCQSDVLAFTDSDCLPEAMWLDRAVAEIENGASIVVGHVEVFSRGGRLHPVEAYELVHAFPQERYVRDHGGGVTANLVMTADVFAAVGPFRADLLSGADIEWGQRARALGFETWFAAEAVVRHPARSSFSEMERKIRRVVRGSHERESRASTPRVGFVGSVPWRELTPPLGAVRRARSLPGGATPWNIASLFVGESFCRLVGVWHHLTQR